MAICAIGLTACSSSTGDDGTGGGPGTPPAPYTAGSRLQPVVLDAGDGAEVFLGFFDAELQVTCSFYPIEDGTYQCIPDPGTPAIPAFADMACSAPAVATCGDFDGYSETTGGMCGVTVVGAYRLGPPLGGPPFIMQATCVELGAGFSDARPATALEAPEFVHGTWENVPVDGDLGVARIVGDDGSAVTIGLTRAGYDCTPTVLEGEVRCLDTMPAARFDVPVFTGADCSGDPVGLFGWRACAANISRKPGLLAEYSLTDPCATPKLFALGDEVDHAYAASDACRELASDQRFAKVGAEITPDALPLLTRVERGTGRLRALSWAAGDTPLFDLRAFHDTALGADCEPSVTASGAWRCAPRAFQSEIFADAACTERLFPPASQTDACGGDPAQFATIGPSVCDPGALHERGELYTGDVYVYADSPVPGCQGPIASDGTIYRLGAEVPVDGLGPLTKVQR